MSYRRTLPRDFFNDGNLLKCVGQLYLCLVREPRATIVMHNQDDPGAQMTMDQDPSSGWTHMSYVALHTRSKVYRLCRPLNSRDNYPLWVDHVADPDFEPVLVLGEDGMLTDEFLELVEGDDNA